MSTSQDDPWTSLFQTALKKKWTTYSPSNGTSFLTYETSDAFYNWTSIEVDPLKDLKDALHKMGGATSKTAKAMAEMSWTYTKDSQEDEMTGTKTLAELFGVPTAPPAFPTVEKTDTTPVMAKIDIDRIVEQFSPKSRTPEELLELAGEAASEMLEGLLQQFEDESNYCEEEGLDNNPYGVSLNAFLSTEYGYYPPKLEFVGEDFGYVWASLKWIEANNVILAKDQKTKNLSNRLYEYFAKWTLQHCMYKDSWKTIFPLEVYEAITLSLLNKITNGNMPAPVDFKKLCKSLISKGHLPSSHYYAEFILTESPDKYPVSSLDQRTKNMKAAAPFGKKFSDGINWVDSISAFDKDKALGYTSASNPGSALTNSATPHGDPVALYAVLRSVCDLFTYYSVDFIIQWKYKVEKYPTIYDFLVKAVMPHIHHKYNLPKVKSLHQVTSLYCHFVSGVMKHGPTLPAPGATSVFGFFDPKHFNEMAKAVHQQHPYLENDLKTENDEAQKILDSFAKYRDVPKLSKAKIEAFFAGPPPIVINKLANGFIAGSQYQFQDSDGNFVSLKVEKHHDPCYNHSKVSSYTWNDWWSSNKTPGVLGDVLFAKTHGTPMLVICANIITVAKSMSSYNSMDAVPLSEVLNKVSGGGDPVLYDKITKTIAKYYVSLVPGVVKNEYNAKLLASIFKKEIESENLVVVDDTAYTLILLDIITLLKDPTTGANTGSAKIKIGPTILNSSILDLLTVDSTAAGSDWQTADFSITENCDCPDCVPSQEDIAEEPNKEPRNMVHKLSSNHESKNSIWTVKKVKKRK